MERYLDYIISHQQADGWLGPTDIMDPWARFPLLLGQPDMVESASVFWLFVLCSLLWYSMSSAFVHLIVFAGVESLLLFTKFTDLFVIAVCSSDSVLRIDARPSRDSLHVQIPATRANAHVPSGELCRVTSASLLLR